LDLLGRGSAAAAAQLLQRAAAAEPGSRSVLEALGRAQFDVGRYAAAADSFRQIVEASPSDDYAHFGLGLALARDGNPAAAAGHLALAAAMRPDLPHYTDALRGVRATLRSRPAATGRGRPGLISPAGRGRAAPATTSPATTSPATTSPATTSPATTSPATTSPATTSPATTSPATTSPAGAGPAMTGDAAPTAPRGCAEPLVSAYDVALLDL